MAILKCKACGAPLNVEQGQTIVECSHCDLQQTIPQMDDELKLQMFDRANDLRRQFEFDSAKSLLQALATQYPEEAEAYWGIFLCKYGIMYVEDQQTMAQIPTFYRMIPQSVLNDEDYIKACQCAGASAWKYEEEAQKIDGLQKKILQLANSEEPYDVFICYKKTDIDTGAQTQDSKIAHDLYDMLLENKYRVFWAERSLPAGCEYEPYIYSALSTAKIMLVLSSDRRYFEATWVKNEWIRFLDMMKNNAGKTLITCYQNMYAEDIPSALRNLQALDMSSTLFSHDLLEQIQRKIPKKREMDTAMFMDMIKNMQNTTQNAETPSIHDRELALENGVYKGEAIAGKPQGFGTYYISNGDRYEGNWNAGKMYGQGTFFYSNGDRYEGFWNDGKMHGQGTFFYSNGDSWSGEWVNNLPWNGSGRYRLKNQGLMGCYEGSWKAGKMHGQGTFFYNNGNSWSGEWNNNLPWNGSGKYYQTKEKEMLCYEGTLRENLLTGEGKIYRFNKLFREGQFERGLLNGQGVAYIGDQASCSGIFRDGRPWEAVGTFSIQGHKCLYNGSWKYGLPCGQGVVTYENGDRVEGSFEDGLTGTVVWNFKDGRRYEGSIRDGRLTGEGKMFGKSGVCLYKGEYLEDKLHGHGVRFLGYGSRYEGEFVNNMYHGQGTMYYQQGSWSGEWKENKRWKGKGLILFTDNNGAPTGKFYNGYVVNGKAAGKGMLRFPDGTRYDGEFLDDGYYNGKIYDANNVVTDVIVNGVSQQQKSRETSQKVWNTAAGVLDFISKL